MVDGSGAGMMGFGRRRSPIGLLATWLVASVLFLGAESVWAAGAALPTLRMAVSSEQTSVVVVPNLSSGLSVTVESAPLDGIGTGPWTVLNTGGAIAVVAPTVTEDRVVELSYSVLDGDVTRYGVLILSILPGDANIIAPSRFYFTIPAFEDAVLGSVGYVANVTSRAGTGAGLPQVVQPLHGTLVGTQNGEFTYTPNTNYSGPDQFAFTLENSDHQPMEFHYTVEVAAVNDAPVATNAAATGPAGSVIEIDLAAYARDADVGDVLTLVFAPSEDPDVGRASWQGTKLRYAAPVDASGNKVIEFIVKDAAGMTARANVTFTIGASEPVVTPRPAGVMLERTSGSEAQSLKLGSETTLALRVLNDKGAAAVGWNVAWDAPPDNEGGGFHLSTRDNVTNDNGVALAKAIVGRIPGTYVVKAIVTEPSATDSNVAGTKHTLSYTIVTGLATALRPGTSEYSVGQVIDAICPHLSQTAGTDDQKYLAARCVEFLDPANEAQVANALRAMAPEEVANEGRMGNGVTMQQLGNVSARLNALRRGVSGVALSGLAFRLDGKILPGEALASLLPDALRGGGASADGGMSRWSAFVSGVIGGGEQSKTDQEEGFEFNTKGLTGGVDYRWSNEFVFGVAGGFAKTGLDLGGAGGGLDAQGFNLALYGTYYRNEKYYFDGVFNLSRNGYDMDRVVDYTIGTTRYQKVANGDPDSNVYAFSLGGGYDVASLNGYTFEANGRLQYLGSTISGYEETGAGAYNLAIEKQEMSLMTVSAGGLFTKAFSFKWGVLVPQLRLTWDHEFSGDAATIKGSFVNGPGSGFNPTFSFKTDEVDRDYFRLGAGTTLVRPGGATAFLQYETTRGKAGYSDYNVALGGRWEF